MRKFERHSAKHKEVEIDGELLKLKPLGSEYIPILMKLMGKFSKDEEKNKELIFKDDEAIELITKLALATMKKSYPDEPEEDIDAFVSSNLLDIMTVVFELNSFGNSNEIEAIKKAEHLRKIKNDSIKTPEVDTEATAVQ